MFFWLYINTLVARDLHIFNERWRVESFAWTEIKGLEINIFIYQRHIKLTKTGIYNVKKYLYFK